MVSTNFKPFIRLFLFPSTELNFSNLLIRELSLNAAIVLVRLLSSGNDGADVDRVEVRLLSQCRTLGSSNSDTGLALEPYLEVLVHVPLTSVV